MTIINISIHSLRVEGDSNDGYFAMFVPRISIHSLRVEGDSSLINSFMIVFDFNPLPPCGGRRVKNYRIGLLEEFQSTPSVWRETMLNSRGKQMAKNFNPLPPCGGRRHRCFLGSRVPDFNPLPPCGGRPFADPLRRGAADFNPLPPCGGRRMQKQADSETKYFNPLPPCGGRRPPTADTVPAAGFQSTPSVWRETRDKIKNPALKRGFQSTPSVWRETAVVTITTTGRAAFQSTPSVWRETEHPPQKHARGANFNPLPPCGGRLPLRAPQ